MAYTINWDMVSVSATNFHVPALKDNFFLSNALLYRWKGKQKEWAGGPVLVLPLGFAPEGGGGSWFSGADKFDTTVRNPIKGANYFAKNAQVTLAIDGDEELAVRGPRQVLDLVASKMKIAENTLIDLVGTNLFNSGTNAKAIGGLGIALPTTIVGTPQTYGGITCGGSAPSADTNGWWQNNANPGPITPTNLFPGNAAASGGPVAQLFAQCGYRGGKTPTVIVSNWGCWTDYHGNIAKNERYDRPQQQTDLAKAGFTNLMYRNCPWVVDERAPHGPSPTYYETLYGIDERGVSLYSHPQRNFAFDGWRKSYDQDVRAGYIFHRTELGFNERRSSFSIGQIDCSTTLPV
jgi:hypothetical protein